MDKKPVIQIKNLSKTFYLKDDAKHTLRSFFTSMFRQGKTRKFTALKDINLEIYKGESVGIIGRNGSGKSTLLKIIAGIYNADKGSKVKVHGRIVPFLELGVGFNMELSGRENIFLNGTILGMSKKFLKEKFEEIVKFAELEEFIDSPVKNYSSGMLVRLAFSIAIQSDADIYILDEILAVGDENFQRKSISIINNLKKKGKTILFVSHSMDAVQQFCSRAVLISESKLIVDGKPSKAIDEYRKINNEVVVTTEQPKVDPNRVGDRSAEIYKVETFINGKPGNVIVDKGDLTVKMHYKLNDNKHKKLLFGVSIFRDDDLYVTGTNTKNYSLPIEAKENGVVEYTISTEYLLDGKYFITVAVFEYETVQFLDFHSKMYPIEVRLYNQDLGAASIPAKWKID
jgi:lipopolysaccharide transport system ATP-binding protein